MHGFMASPKSTFNYPIKIGSWPQKRYMASYRSGKWANVVSGRYTPMNGVLDMPLTNLKLTTSGLWKRIDSRLYPIVWSCNTSAIPTYALPALAGQGDEQNVF